MLRLSLALLCSAGVLAALAQEPKPAKPKAAERVAINDPAKLVDDKDFALQGEYFGEKADKSDRGSGQLIALGEGKFRLKAFDKGLPGVDPHSKAHDFDITGERVGDTVELKGKGQLMATVKGGAIVSPEAGDYPLKKVARTSPTVGAKPPAGADVLFGAAGDETNWDGGKLVKLSDGEFLGVGCKSKKTYGDFTAHVEFRLPWMPNSRGQGRGNSGFYPQDRYEVQVLDSFGLKGENNECGGIYTIAKPSINMCLPPMAWQTYDIDFTAAKFDGSKKTTNARITVKHNGVTIHDNVELPKATGGGQVEGPTPGPFQLQNHGDPVVYRNIWALAR